MERLRLGCSGNVVGLSAKGAIVGEVFAFGGRREAE